MIASYRFDDGWPGSTPGFAKGLPGVPANFQHVSFCQLQTGCIVTSDIRLTKSDLSGGEGAGAVITSRLAAKCGRCFKS